MPDVDDLSDVMRVVPERVVYDPQTLTVTVPAGKTLKIETLPDGEEPYTITAPDVDLIAVITVSLREA